MKEWDYKKIRILKEWDTIRRKTLTALEKLGHDITITPDENGNEADIYRGEK